MSKIDLTDTVAGYNLQVINNNFDAIEDALNNKVLYRDNPTGEPNQMVNDLDMNGLRILNSPKPINPTDLVRLQDLGGGGSGGITSAEDVVLVASAPITADNVQDAFNQVATNMSTVSTQLNNQGNAILGRMAVFTSVAQYKATTTGQIAGPFLISGYYSSGDGGGGIYYPDFGDTTTADNGGSVLVNASNQRAKLFGRPEYTPEQFGGGGIGGGVDDMVYINKAIAALPNRGGTVFLMGKTYNVGSPMVIGNGNNAGIPSTKNGIRVIGMGGGGSFFAPVPTVLQVIDGGQTSPYIDSVVNVLGPIASVHLEGFQIYCHGVNSPLANTALTMNSFGFCTVKNIQGSFYKNIGLNIQGGQAPTGNYNVHNVFNECAFASNSDGNIGLLMDGVASVSNDTWISSFNDCRFETSTAQNAIAGMLKFVDSINFNRCHFVGDNVNGVGQPGCVGLYFNAVGNPGFPSGILFNACSVLTTFVNENATDKIRKNTFQLYGTYDNETIPTHPFLIGYTDQGVRFNGWGA